MAKKYSAKDIEVLEGLEPVRKRPGMYIAGTDTPAGLHQLVFEILDNSVDEAMNGHAKKIEVILHEDLESVTVSDDGRGIPVEKHPKFKKSALELILTTLHAGGKFSDQNYQTSGGLHGVGSSVVNALSEEMVATVKREGKEFQQSFSQGKPTSTLKTTKKSARGTGTSIFFRPDPEIFQSITFNAQHIRSTIQTKAYLNPGLKLTFVNEAEDTKEEFVYEEGLQAFLKQTLEEKKLGVIGGEIFSIEREEDAKVSISFCWTDSRTESFRSYANGIYTPEGGSHENGAKSGIVRAVRNYVNVHDAMPKGVKLTADDVREGLLCFISVLLPSSRFKAQYQGQTKDKLNNPEITPIVEGVVKSFEQMLNEKPTAAKEIIDRVVLAAKARAASRQAANSVTKKLKISHRLNLPGKLADCSSSHVSETELFIVEGDSAGGSTKQGRDRNSQAVLPLRGKVLNSITSSAKKVAENKELSNIINALGCGIGDSCDPKKIRYGKVIILTDADADGMHISTLLLAFFFSHMRPLIEEGHLFIGKPPLYGVFPKGASASSGKKTKGKKKQSSAFWAFSDEELEQVIKKQKLTTPRITRYKGLGEMNPDTLWDTTLDPESRTLLRVTVDDEGAVMAGLQALMGNDTSTRYQLIQSNAGTIELDI